MRIGGLTDAVVTSSLLESVESVDLTAYEFVGRFPVLVSLSSLDEEQLVQIVSVPEEHGNFHVAILFRSTYSLPRMHFELLLRKALPKTLVHE
ncbi:hypothetical protein MTR67_010037, partial [Solanum verrucosum]